MPKHLISVRDLSKEDIDLLRYLSNRFRDGERETLEGDVALFFLKVLQGLAYPLRRLVGFWGLEPITQAGEKAQ